MKLPVLVNVHFSVFKIISSINVAQDEDYHSFPLFSICSSVTGYLYRVRMQKIKNFVTTMTISGEGFSTGKSLMYEAIMLALYGKRLQCATPTTVPRLYEMLAAGVPIYGMCCFAVKMKYFYLIIMVCDYNLTSNRRHRTQCKK